MSQIKLKHSGGNSVIIAAPDSNPASDRTLKLPSDGDGTILTTNSSVGKILQIVQTTKTDTASTSSTSFADILTVSITPTAASSNFLLFGDLKIGYGSYQAAVMWKFVRDSTDIFIGDADGNRARCTWGIEDTSDSSNDSVYHIASTHGMFLDTTANTTSAISYKVQWKAQQNTAYLNRTGDDANGLAYPRTASSITVMEIAG